MGRKVWVPVVSGPLAPYAAGFESRLRSRAYPLATVGDRLYQLDQLSRWLERAGLGVGELTGEQAERFVAARRAAGRVTWVSPQSVMLPLGYLRELGVAPTPAAVARLLLAEREGPDGLELGAALGGGRELAPGARAPEAQRVSSAGPGLRAAVVGALPAPGGADRGAVGMGGPSVADLRDRTLPRGLEPAAVKKLLASCDRRTLIGRRDDAILLSLARLGLRAGEVAAIQLEDVDCSLTGRAVARTCWRYPSMSARRSCRICAVARGASAGRCFCGRPRRAES